MGFSGDGLSCVPLPCNEFSNCNQNARCVLNSRGNYECQCSRGNLHLKNITYFCAISATGSYMQLLIEHEMSI